MNRLVVIILFTLLAGSICTAQESSDTLQLYFRQGYSRWEPDYKENGACLDKFVNRFKQLRADSIKYSLSKIHIVSGTSPEGTWKFNQRLSKKRVDCIREVLNDNIVLPDSLIVEDSRGINWKGLRELVAGSNMQYREKVLDIIDNSPELYKVDGVTRELRKRRLVWLEDGKPWKYMYNNFFPLLRSFSLQVVIERNPEPKPEKVEEPLPVVEVDTVITPEPEPEPIPVIDTKSPFYMAVKTNMLYDLALVPNIGLEFYLGKNWSVAGNWMYSWWRNKKHNRFWRIYGGDLEVRKYFGSKAAEKPLQGWHVGVYGQMLTYDVELGGRGYLGDRWTWGGGLSIGYSLPVKKRLNIDFTLGLGYLGGEYKEYLPIDGHYVWQVTKDRNWFGPTKLEVSLVWLIGRGNVNAKGGAK